MSDGYVVTDDVMTDLHTSHMMKRVLHLLGDAALTGSFSPITRGRYFLVSD